MSPNHTAIKVLSSGSCRAGIGRSSGESVNTGRHKKAPVRCPMQPVGCTAWHYMDALSAVSANCIDTRILVKRSTRRMKSWTSDGGHGSYTIEVNRTA